MKLSVNSSGDLFLLESISVEHSAIGVPTQVLRTVPSVGSGFASVLIIPASGSSQRITVSLNDEESELLKKLQDMITKRIENKLAVAA